MKTLNEKYLRNSFKICIESCFLEKEMEKQFSAIQKKNSI